MPIETVRGICRFIPTKKNQHGTYYPTSSPNHRLCPPSGGRALLGTKVLWICCLFPPLCLFIPRRQYPSPPPPGETAIFNPSSLDRTGGSNLPPPNAAIARPPATAPHSSSARHPPNSGLCHPSCLTRLSHDGAMTTMRKTSPLFYCIFVSSPL